MIAQVMGVIDQLGYFRCIECVAKYDREWSYPVFSDAAPHNAEPCDACGERMPDHRIYVGDGVYAEYDGCGIWLITQRESGEHRIYLEPQALQTLNEFAGAHAAKPSAYLHPKHSHREPV